MRIGGTAFLKLRPDCFCSPVNGCNQRPTRKTLFRTLSSSSGVATTTLHNRGLLYAAVRSLALDFIRRDARRARREATVLAEAEPAIEPHFELEDDTQSALAAAVESLPRDQREVLVLKIWNDLTFSEIAGALGISQNTAASRYRYALTNLKKTLQPQ